MKLHAWWIAVVVVILAVSPAGGVDAKADKPAEKERPPKISIDKKAGTVSFPVKVADQGRYEVLKGAIEYLLVADGGKSYESLFVTKCSPAAILDALKKVGAKPGKPASDNAGPKGSALKIFAEYKDKNGKKVRKSADEFVLHAKRKKPLKPATWAFTGSRTVYNPETEKKSLEATVTRNLVGLHLSDTSPLVQNSRTEARDENIYKTNLKALPKAGSDVTMVFELVKSRAPAGHKRVHLFISGRVQGVGFRAFTQRSARRLKLTGWVKNLRDGRVEAVIEGPADKVDELIKKVKRGPRAARVEKLESTDETPKGDFDKFKVTY